ncbi:MAG: recombination mediator RecR [Terrimicrobiaceae bacterium]|nr:recombination mediator RecR [Terrimicrobiaceae bacterium]
MPDIRPADYPEPFLGLMRELQRLPGIGPRGAERIALWLVSHPSARPAQLAQALEAAAALIRPCPRCGFFAEGGECAICADPARAGREICVVEQATDVVPIERSGGFHGRYHVLGGRLAPLDGIGPEHLTIEKLAARAASEKPTEIILALSADGEGEATTSYLRGALAGTGVPVSRIAHGLPAGGGLDHADALTLQRALAGRRAL